MISKQVLQKTKIFLHLFGEVLVYCFFEFDNYWFDNWFSSLEKVFFDRKTFVRNAVSEFSELIYGMSLKFSKLILVVRSKIVDKGGVA